MKALVTLTIFASPTSALAHWGHVGEVAGHGHWIAVGALVVAGVIAGLLGKTKNNDAKPDETAETDVEGLEGETA